LLQIYQEQLGSMGAITRPYNYMPDDIVYRLPWWMGDDEPPQKILYPILYKVGDIETIDPLTIYIGHTPSKKIFGYNPRYIVNPLMLIVGTPGAGKSLHPFEEVLVIRKNKLIRIPIKDVVVGDKVLAIDEHGNVYVSDVMSVWKHEFEGDLIVVEFIGPHGKDEVKVTPDHSLLIWDNGAIKPIRGDEISEGDEMPVLGIKPMVDIARVVKIRKIPYTGPVYDIETTLDTFMLANGLFVHNSATLKTIIYNFIRNEYFSEGGRVPPIIVVDPEGEYSVLRQLLNPNDVLHLKLGRRDYINIFDRPTKTIDPRVWYMRMLAVIQKFLYLSPAQAVQAYRVLKRAILKLAEKKGFTGDPATWIHDDITLEDVYNYIVTLIKTIEKTKKPSIEEKKLLSGAETLLSRLDMWMQPPNDAFSRKSTVNLSKIFKYKLIILDARGLSKDLFGMFTYWITYWIYGLMLEKGPLPSFGIRVVLIIDEAWALLRKTSKKEEENPLEAMARRGRKYGIMIIVATQTPEDVDKKMFSLFGTLVTGIIPSAEMRKKIVESRGMPKRFEEVIGRLEQGQLVWHINWRRRNFPMSGMPIIVKVDYPLKDKPLKRVVFA